MARGVWGCPSTIFSTPHAPYDNYIIIGEKNNDKTITPFI